MRRITIVAFACLLLAGCATLKPVDQAKVDGMWTRKVAEDAYIDIRMAYNAGGVAETDMARTVVLMREWHAAYVALVAAIMAVEAGEEADLEALTAKAREPAIALQAWAVVVLAKPKARAVPSAPTARSRQWRTSP